MRFQNRAMHQWLVVLMPVLAATTGLAQGPASRPAGTPVAATAPATQPADDEASAVAAVRAVVQRMIVVAKANKVEEMPNFYVPEDAQALRSLVTGIKDLAPRLAAFEKLAQEKLGIEVPAPIRKALRIIRQPDTTQDFASVNPEKFRYVIDGRSAAVHTPSGQKHSFAKTGDEWLLELDPAARRVIVAFGDLAKAQIQFLDGITAGIKDGAITGENFEAQAGAIGDKTMRLPMQRASAVLTEMVKAQIRAAAAGTPGSQPATAPASPR